MLFISFNRDGMTEAKYGLKFCFIIMHSLYHPLNK